MTRSLSALALAAVLTVAPVLPLAAQNASHEDLRALRFYLQQNDTPAAQAELRRLRATFPDWRPPADLNELMSPAAAGASVDEGAIWRRIEARDYPGARRLIDEGRGRVAGWTPPSDMLRVLETNEAQDSFDQAVIRRDATTAIAVARRAPQLFSCERINNAWQLADMYVLAGQNATAVATYRNTVQSCPSFGQMQPSLEKASAIASPAELSGMFDVARSANPGARPQLDALQARLLGGATPVATATPRPAVSGTPAPTSAPTPAAAPVAAPVASVPAAPVPMGSLPLRGDGRAADVRRLKEQQQYARCLAASNNPRSIEVLYERGWCAFGHQRPTEAMVAFQQVIRSGSGLGGTVIRDAHFGLALTQLAMNMTEQGAHSASLVPLTDQQRREVETAVLDQRGVRAYRAGDYRQAIAAFDQMERINGSLRRDLRIMRAYAYLNSGQRGIAREEFERLHAQLATAETRQGLNLARNP
jgi:hypothetical protein